MHYGAQALQAPKSLLAAFPLVLYAACADSGELRRYTPEDLTNCPDCRIGLEFVAELGSEADTIWATSFSEAVQMPDGRFLVATTDHPGAQIIYAASGSLEHVFGRAGQGPGEYMTWTTPFIGPGDTVNIADRHLQRRTVIDGSGNVVRTHVLPQRSRKWVFVGNMLITQADIATPENIGFPLHRVDSETGAVVQSFAEVDNYLDPLLDGYRNIAAAGDSGLWVAPPNDLIVDFYDLKLRKSRSVQLQATWFLPHRNTGGVPGETPPDSRFIAIWQSNDGLLWALAKVADATWKPIPTPKGEAIGVEYSRATSDWVLAVFDPTDGRQLAAAQFDPPMSKGNGDDLVYFSVDRPAGGLSFTAYRPTYSER